jgi:hypothetical protein
MSSDPSKLRHQQRTGAAQTQLGVQAQNAAMEFASADDLLRYDREKNPVPPELAERLNQSLLNEPKAPRPWFRRIFGG